MRIGFDAYWARTVGSGTASYTTGLVRALAARGDCELVLYFRSGDETLNPLFPLDGPNVERRIVDGRGQIGRTFLSLTRACARDAIDVYQSPGYFLPLWPGPRVATFHDVNMFLQWRRWWDTGSRLKWLSMTAQTPLMARLASRIVTVSETSAQDIRRVLRLPRDRVTVVYQGIDEVYFRPASPDASARLRAEHDLGEYVLYVGVLTPLKNLEGIVRAFALARRNGLKLAIGGKPQGSYFEGTVRPLIRRLGIADRVEVLGLVPGEALPGLYEGARALIYPSFSEGFGLPPLEAMARGTPVIASNRPSFPEVLGDAGLLVDPTDPSAIAGALDTVLTDAGVRERLVERGRERAARFRWSTAAARMAEVYSEVARC